MEWIALVGPEHEENLSLRYLAASLSRRLRGQDRRLQRRRGFPGGHRRHRRRRGRRCWSACRWRSSGGARLPGARRRAARGRLPRAHHRRRALRDLRRGRAAARLPRARLDLPAGGGGDAGRAARARWRRAPPGTTSRAWSRATATAARASRRCRRCPISARCRWPVARGEPARCFGHGIAPLVSSRGCYANCTFCCIAAWHEQTLPGKRYRLREPDDVADEMVAMQRERGIDIFVFHDDNFFVPGHSKSLERFHALADALEAAGLRASPPWSRRAPPTSLPRCSACWSSGCTASASTSASRPTPIRGWRRCGAGRSSRQNHRAIDVVRSSSSTPASTC